MTSTDTGASAFRVRPYLLTGGRTRSAVELALETIVRSTPQGHSALESLGMERKQIVSLCAEPQSLAEVSAHLNIHLQVARVLLGDLITEGHVSLQAANAQPADRPDLALLERVLDGLQAL